MIGFLRRIFDSSPARVSKDVRIATGYAHKLAVACGAPKVNTAYMLAAVAKHPIGNELLVGHAREVLAEVCGKKLGGRPTPLPTKGRLESEEEVRELIQRMVKDALAAPKRSAARCVELTDIIRVLRTMPHSTAYPILQRAGLAPKD